MTQHGQRDGVENVAGDGGGKQSPAEANHPGTNQGYQLHGRTVLEGKPLWKRFDRQESDLRADEQLTDEALGQPDRQARSRQRVEKRLCAALALARQQHRPADHAIRPRHDNGENAHHLAETCLLPRIRTVKQRHAAHDDRSDQGQRQPDRSVLAVFLGRNRWPAGQ